MLTAPELVARPVPSTVYFRVRLESQFSFRPASICQRQMQSRLDALTSHVRFSGYFENVWAWVADHGLDQPPNIDSQIDIYSARGILIKSQGPTWLYSTTSEGNLPRPHADRVPIVSTHSSCCCTPTFYPHQYLSPRPLLCRLHHCLMQEKIGLADSQINKHIHLQCGIILLLWGKVRSRLYRAGELPKAARPDFVRHAGIIAL